MKPEYSFRNLIILLTCIPIRLLVNTPLWLLSELFLKLHTLTYYLVDVLEFIPSLEVDKEWLESEQKKRQKEFFENYTNNIYGGANNDKEACS